MHVCMCNAPFCHGWTGDFTIFAMVVPSFTIFTFLLTYVLLQLMTIPWNISCHSCFEQATMGSTTGRSIRDLRAVGLMVGWAALSPIRVSALFAAKFWIVIAAMAAWATCVFVQFWARCIDTNLDQVILLGVCNATTSIRTILNLRLAAQVSVSHSRKHTRGWAHKVTFRGWCYEMKVIQAFSWALFALFTIAFLILQALVQQAERFGRFKIWKEPIRGTWAQAAYPPYMLAPFIPPSMPPRPLPEHHLSDVPL